MADSPEASAYSRSQLLHEMKRRSPRHVISFSRLQLPKGVSAQKRGAVNAGGSMFEDRARQHSPGLVIHDAIAVSEGESVTRTVERGPH